MVIGIKGHPKRGEEVIKLLKTLGGRTKYSSSGEEFIKGLHWYITDIGLIDWFIDSRAWNLKMITLEELKNDTKVVVVPKYSFPFQKFGKTTLEYNSGLYKNYYNMSTVIGNQRMSVSGVDEDEEALNLIKFQNAYNMASKLISTLSEMYDKLINETARNTNNLDDFYITEFYYRDKTPRFHKTDQLSHHRSTITQNPYTFVPIYYQHIYVDNFPYYRREQ